MSEHLNSNLFDSLVISCDKTDFQKNLFSGVASKLTKTHQTSSLHIFVYSTAFTKL